MRGVLSSAKGSDVVSSICFEAILSARELLKGLDLESGHTLGLALSLSRECLPAFMAPYGVRAKDQSVQQWYYRDADGIVGPPAVQSFEVIFETAKLLRLDFDSKEGSDARAKVLAHCETEPKTECLRYQDFLQFAHEDESMRQAAAARKNELLNKCSIPEAADYAVMKLLQPVQTGFDNTDRDALAILFHLDRQLFQCCASYHLAFVARTGVERSALAEMYKFAGRAYNQVEVGLQAWHRVAEHIRGERDHTWERRERKCYVTRTDEPEPFPPRIPVLKKVREYTHTQLREWAEDPQFVGSVRSYFKTVTNEGPIEAGEVLESLMMTTSGQRSRFSIRRALSCFF